MTFRVGQKVARVSSICTRGLSPPLHKPVTISNVYTDWLGITIIEIEEYPAPATLVWNAGFVAHHFRHVQERPTDISVFRKMLTPSKVSA